jgi:hypothetical protein
LYAKTNEVLLGTYPEYKLCPYEDPADCPDERDHNPNDHHYGCECDNCMAFYQSLKR